MMKKRDKHLANAKKENNDVKRHYAHEELKNRSHH